MMTTARPASEATAQAVLDAAMAHYERAIQTLQDILVRLQAGELERATDARHALSELNKATQTAFDERARLEKRLASWGEGGDGGGLDLDEARDEVGRRLARLRAARDAGNFSE